MIRSQKVLRSAKGQPCSARFPGICNGNPETTVWAHLNGGAFVSEDVKLLPCPHCGEAEHLYPAYRNMGDAAPYAIDCIGCGADFTPREGKDVIAAWNRRAYLAATKPPLADVTPIGWTSQNNIDGLNDHDSFVIGSIVNRPSDEMNIPIFLASPPMPGRGEGFVLVPVDLTEEMWDAFFKARDDIFPAQQEAARHAGRGWKGLPAVVWDAMLAASRPKEDTHAK